MFERAAFTEIAHTAPADPVIVSFRISAISVQANECNVVMMKK